MAGETTRTVMNDPFSQLLTYKRNTFSQNGEDGVIRRIFDVIGKETGTCCEFGAWDGVHLSNCRQLILEGWRAVMIEGDAVKFGWLAKTYAGNERVRCINAYVDDSHNRLSEILKTSEAPNLDFLSIDIDGLDYEVFEGLDVSPRVICVEVNAGHSPAENQRLPKELAQNNIGQPLAVFSAAAKAKGYGLACYTGNAFYIRQDVMARCGASGKTDEEAYSEFLASLSRSEREWLYLVNKGLNPPHHNYHNPYLRGRHLRIPLLQRAALLMHAWPNVRR